LRLSERRAAAVLGNSGQAATPAGGDELGQLSG